MWVARWNRLEFAPFLFHRTCSCSLGNAIDGVHASIYLARSYGSNGEFHTCDVVPTTGVTSQGLMRILAGAIASLLTVRWELALSGVGQSPGLAGGPPYPSATVHTRGDMPLASQPGAQRVPDSPLDGNPSHATEVVLLKSERPVLLPVLSPPTAGNELVMLRTKERPRASRRRQ